MAKYGPITKTLKKARPIVRSSDGVVKMWEIRVEYSYDGDETTTPVQPSFKRIYPYQKDVEYLNKTVDQFTKEELIGLMRPEIDDEIFDTHYEAFISTDTKIEEAKHLTAFEIESLT